MTSKVKKPFSLFLLCALAILAFGVQAAQAGQATLSPWWHLTSRVIPTNLKPGGEGTIVVQALNLGDARTSGPVDLMDVLPAGVTLQSVQFFEVSAASSEDLGPGGEKAFYDLCETSASRVLCSTESKAFPGYEPTEEALVPFGYLELRLRVKVEPQAVSGGNEVRASGGGAPAATVTRPLPISEVTPGFGLEDFSLVNEETGGGVDTRAGSHPYQLTNTLTFNRDSGEPLDPPAMPRDLQFRLPPGEIGNATALARCSDQDFAKILPGGSANHCPGDTAIGVSTVTIATFPHQEVAKTVPVFNLTPAVGEPARFGFEVLGNPVILDTAVRSGNGEDYGVTVNVQNITQVVGFLSATTVFWGAPADPSHNEARGWGCLRGGVFVAESGQECEHSHDTQPAAFLTLPTSCTGRFSPTVAGSSWPVPGGSGAEPAAVSFPAVEYSPLDAFGNSPAIGDCNQLAFSPTIAAKPTTESASSPSGLDFDLNFDDEGLTSGSGVAQSQLKDTTVVLPEGFTIDPSAGVGLGGCSPAQYASESVESAEGAGCPGDSKLGTVEIETPLLEQKIEGSIFIAQPYENPFPEPAAGHPNGTLVALYIVARNPETGILVKLAGKVTPNPVTGQLSTTFENNPQLPFDHFRFKFREGQQAPLISPPTCGAFTTLAELTPWSDPLAVLTDSASFTIAQGAAGGACPGAGAGGIPFHPLLQAGTQNDGAGVFSPLDLRLTRTDAEQEISSFSTDLPPGLTGDLSGIPFCPEADIALARTKSGAQEQAEPSCPAASRLGHTEVGTGVGAVLAYVPGKIYLAGAYNGDPFSLVSVTSAVVGPFDLGTVVLRFGLKIDPHTAQVSVDPTASEPIPTIIDGIVTHVRDIQVYVDRQGFTLNPTSCSQAAISSTLASNLGASTAIVSPFQVTNCQALKFAPKFTVSTSGKTSKAKGAGLKVKLTYPKAPAGTYANIARVKVDLPKQLPSQLKTLQKACRAKQFELNPANCPKESMVGKARAITPLIPVPLEGPAIFVSHGNEAFPSLIMVLKGAPPYDITIDLVGTTFISKAGITSSTFKTVPDQPIGSFELTLPQGKYSALAANGNLCTVKGGLKMPTEFLAQNGAKINETTKISVTGCAKKKLAKKKAATKQHKKTSKKAAR